MQLITHQHHINRLLNSPLKTHIQNRYNQIIEESEDVPPIFLLVESDDDITGPDFSIVGPNGLLTDLWEVHEPGHPKFVRPYEWVSYLPTLKTYELLFLICGEDGYWIYIPEDYVEAHPALKWVLTSPVVGGLSEPQPLY